MTFHPTQLEGVSAEPAEEAIANEAEPGYFADNPLGTPLNQKWFNEITGLLRDLYETANVDNNDARRSKLTESVQGLISSAVNAAIGEIPGAPTPTPPYEGLRYQLYPTVAFNSSNNRENVPLFFVMRNKKWQALPIAEFGRVAPAIYASAAARTLQEKLFGILYGEVTVRIQRWTNQWSIQSDVAVGDTVYLTRRGNDLRLTTEANLSGGAAVVRVGNVSEVLNQSQGRVRIQYNGLVAKSGAAQIYTDNQNRPTNNLRNLISGYKWNDFRALEFYTQGTSAVISHNDQASPIRISAVGWNAGNRVAFGAADTDTFIIRSENNTSFRIPINEHNISMSAKS